ncbi:hypothetical protein [Paraburkholderia kururiensis]|uniref:Uncharacterized protein n=1 Tax=Paraburkholderia kururiensis TaxID=984307 RepID=A0ABZ0WG10_9BURK|nr:hypothetical protein [Paraburkholderia kururiensis]WQD76279.1 hypothetical protein U0042_19475 [Paraburkholderia kururiensis]
MPKPIVIYGNAVQDARNRLRSAQISTMLDVLRNAAFADSGETATRFAAELESDIEALPAAPVDKPKAQQALENAKRRIAAFVAGDSVRDVFAVGDALRYVGEYIEEGGAPESVAAFRGGLRNAFAFKSSNRAREGVSGYIRSERPELGLFKWKLLDGSVIKYMERFYGSYLGADISGTTTDALAALAWLLWDRIRPTPDQRNLQFQASSAIATGHELVPIAAMVLQYHHSLLECGTALALTSKAMSDKPALASYNLYDYTTLANTGTAPIDQLLANGNQTLAADLGGCGLTVIRDFIDIDNARYPDCEIALLVANPAANDLFSLAPQYQTFADARRAGAIEGESYAKGDPTLQIVAKAFLDLMGLELPALSRLIKSDRNDLDALKNEDPQTFFDNLDDAIAEAVNPHASATSTRNVGGPVPATTLPVASAIATASSAADIASTAGRTTVPLPSAGAASLSPEQLQKALAIVELLGK